MQSNYSDNTVNTIKTHIIIAVIIVFTLCFVIPSFIFPQYLVAADIIAVNLFFSFFTLFFISYFFDHFLFVDIGTFNIRLFPMCIIFCLAYIVLQYILSYVYTPNLFPFVVGNGRDQFLYWDLGKQVNSAINSNSSWGFLNKLEIADRGFPLWVGALMHIFGENQISLKIINSILTGFTAIFITLSVYNITNKDIIAKLSGIFYAFLPTVGYLSSLYLKESLMIFIMAFWMYSITKLSKKSSITHICILLICILLTFLFRTFLGIALIVLTTLYFLTKGIISFIITFIIGIIIISTNVVNDIESNEVLNQEISKNERYIYEQSFYKANNSMSVVEKAGGLTVLLPLSPIMPIPSMLDARSSKNIEKVGLLYRIHIELFRIVLFYFFYLGILYIIKNKDYKFFIYLAGGFLILFANAYVGVLTYYRYMSPSLIFTLPIVAYGIDKYNENFKKNSIGFAVYCIIIILIVSIYNVYRIYII